MLSIGKFAAAGGVGVETIRFYQGKGLLRIPAQNGGIRYYGEEDISRLKFIRNAQTAGFTLAEIKELLSMDANKDRGKVQKLASARIEMLNIQIAELQHARDALKRLAVRCEKENSEACPILDSFI
ncbi:MAG: MerR family transcriptional regulator [Candidatus Gracilibacteria bacterium]